jgi:hypothetical protein
LLFENGLQCDKAEVKIAVGCLGEVLLNLYFDVCDKLFVYERVDQEFLFSPIGREFISGNVADVQTICDNEQHFVDGLQEGSNLV